jgi:hypothetical protein
VAEVRRYLEEEAGKAEWSAQYLALCSLRSRLPQPKEELTEEHGDMANRKSE